MEGGVELLALRRQLLWINNPKFTNICNIYACIYVWYDLLENFRLKNQVISFSRCSSLADSVALTCSTAMPVHPETTWDVARHINHATSRFIYPFHLKKLYPQNVPIQIFTRIYHFQKITTKKTSENKSFVWKNCLGHVLAGDAHALRPAARTEARLLQALRHLEGTNDFHLVISGNQWYTYVYCMYMCLRVHIIQGMEWCFFEKRSIQHVSDY